MTGSRTAAAGAMVAAVATLGLAVWMYRMPAAVTSPWGLNPPGLEQFRSLWRLRVTPVSPATFRIGFWLLVAAAWSGYGWSIAAGLRGGRLPGLIGAAAVALLMAVACPPLLSRDVYGYVGFGRLAASHHLNPMLTSQSRLLALGDPVGRFLGGDVPSPYGPLWSGISVGLVRMTGGCGLVGQVLAFKLAMAIALLLAALGARRAAEAIAAGRGPLAFSAVAFNPLFLLEGPGTGHNDLAMLALVLAAFAALAEARPRLAAVAVGAGAAIKLLPALLLPWLMWGAGQRRRVRLAAEVLVLGLLPVVLAFLPFWAGRATFAGLSAWWTEGHRGAAGSTGPIALALASYAAISWFVARAPELPALATGWALATTAAIVFAAGAWFPWYFTWPLAGLLVRWDRRHVAGAAVVMLLVALFTGFYAGP